MKNKELIPMRWSGTTLIPSVLAASVLIFGAYGRAQDAQPVPANTPAPQSVPAGSGSVATQAGSTAPQAKGTTMIDSTSYVIGAEDVLQVTVWKEPTFSGIFPVRPDGMISLVLAGDIPAAGLTPIQLSNDITNRLKKYIQDPSVSVVITAVNSQRIFMIGEIGRVGPLMLSPGMTPLQAIAAAGGLSTFANSKHIYILRGPQGKQVKIPFNYKQALKGDSKQLVTLQPGDTIVVP